jgi:type I site-specific restriction endonuclease
MALLGEEKGYKVSTAALNKVIAKAHEQYDQYDSTKKLIQEYGEEKFWNTEKQELHSIVLIQQIQATLAYTEKQKNPKTAPSEINFQAKQDYEDLLESQINSLKIVIL